MRNIRPVLSECTLRFTDALVNQLACVVRTGCVQVVLHTWVGLRIIAQGIGVDVVDGGYENPVKYEYVAFRQMKPKKSLIKGTGK